MRWKLGRPIKKFAEDIKREFDGILKDTGSFLNEYRYVVKFRHAGMNVQIFIHFSLSKFWIVINNYSNEEDHAICFGTPWDPTYNRQIKGLIENEDVPVFVTDLFGGAEEAAARSFCSKPENRQDLRLLKLQPEEGLTFYQNAMEARLSARDISFLKTRIGILGRLFARNRKLREKEIFLDHSFRLIPGGDVSGGRAAANELPRHFFGALGDEALPECRNCKQSLHLLATIDLSDPIIGLTNSPMQYCRIITCLNCDSYVSPIYFNFSEDSFSLLEQQTGQTFGEFPSFIPMRSLSILPYDENEANESGVPLHQLGGSPKWIQSPDIPRCTKCDKDMAFAAQMATDDALGVQFNDNGNLYVYLCNKCKIVATFVQSH